MKTKKIIINFLLSTLIALNFFAFFTHTFAQEQGTDWPNNISIATGSYGGGMFMGGSALAAVLQKGFPNINTTVEVTGASMENSRLISSREVEIGLITTDVAYEAYNGVDNFEEIGPIDAIRTILPGYAAQSFVVTNSKFNFKSLKDLDGKIFSPGNKNSANEVITSRLIKFGAFKPSALQPMKTPDAADALKNEQIHGFSISLPNTTVMELDVANPGLVQLLTLDKEELDEFIKMFPHYTHMILKAGSLSCVTEDLPLFGVYINFFAHKDLPEDFVYAIVKAAYENRETIIKNSNINVYNDMDPSNIDKTTVPYHKGSVRYYEEIGVKIPNELLPPEI